MTDQENIKKMGVAMADALNAFKGSGVDEMSRSSLDTFCSQLALFVATERICTQLQEIDDRNEARAQMIITALGHR